MCKNLFVLALFLLVAAHLTTTDAGRTSSRTSNSGYGRQRYYGSQAPQPTQPPAPETPKQYLDKRSGFSTFGIIAIIFVAIVLCLAFYYGIMCYPFLCRDEKMKYSFVDVSSTITTATSRSSIENYPVDQKH